MVKCLIPVTCVHNRGVSAIQGSRLEGSTASGYQGTGVSGYWGIGVSGYWGIGVSGYWGIRVLGYQGIRVLGYQGIRHLAIPSNRTNTAYTGCLQHSAVFAPGNHAFGNTLQWNNMAQGYPQQSTTG